MILYAPIIDPKVPAFIGYSTMANIDVNFTHNHAVAPEAVKNFKLLIWKYNDSTKKTQLEFLDSVSSYDLNKGQVKFTLSGLDSDFLQAGMYYKIQIAYIDADGPGPYSTVGISRYIGEQNMIEYGVKSYNQILQEDWTNNQNFNSIQYSGYYKNEQVPSEIVYQYRFILTDNNEKIVQDTQWQIPGNSTEASMSFIIEQDLQPHIKYNLNFQIQTINGLILSKNYTIIETLQPPSLYKGQITAFQDGEAIDNGYVKIQLSGTNDTEGYYRLVRHCDNEVEDKWDEIASFTLPSTEADLSKYYWKDFTVEHGNSYTYALQQYSSDEPRAYSERIKAKPIIVSFEHMFLSDEERQLRIAFNPKVSSFKETILEQKTDTIGSQFPFFSRNGHVRYKELPISGLISYWMDSEEYFGLTIPELQLPFVKTSQDSTSRIPARRTNLDDINFKAERQFKLAVLKWLNNGKPKLFRSPAEGNYIIRLMNISLSPTDGLGRMLHSFSATGYEIAEYNSKNLAKEELSFIQYNMYTENISNIDFDMLVKYGNHTTFTITADNVFPCVTGNYTVVKIYSLQLINNSTVTLEYKDGTIKTFEPADIIDDLNNITTIQTDGSVLCYAFVKTTNFVKIQRGDLDGDGKITENDLTLLLNILDESNIIYYDNYTMDVNDDKKINTRDIGLLQLYLDNQQADIKPFGNEETVFYNSKWLCADRKNLSLPNGYVFYSYACFNDNNDKLEEYQYRLDNNGILNDDYGQLPQTIEILPENTKYIQVTIGSMQYEVPPIIFSEGVTAE